MFLILQKEYKYPAGFPYYGAPVIVFVLCVTKGLWGDTKATKRTDMFDSITGKTAISLTPFPPHLNSLISLWDDAITS